MKKLRMIIALMIAMVIMCISASSVFAIDTEADVELYDEIEELHDLCMMSVNVYGASAKDDNIDVYPERFEYLIENIKSSNYDSQEWYFNSWRMNHVFMELIKH